MTAPRRLPSTGFLYVASGQAAASLAELINQPVDVWLEPLHHLQPANLPDYLRQHKLLGEGVRMTFTGDSAGAAYFLLSTENAAKLLAAAAGPDSPMAGVLEPGPAVLVEVGNILLNANVGTLANQMAQRIQYQPPEYLAAHEPTTSIEQWLGISAEPEQTWRIMSSHLRVGTLDISAGILICLNTAAPPP